VIEGDLIEQFKREAAEVLVVRACHSCKHQRRGQETTNHRTTVRHDLCDAAGRGTSIARLANYCGPELRWWEPKLPPPEPVHLLRRLQRWLIS
jgi:hypothetical protein